MSKPYSFPVYQVNDDVLLAGQPQPHEWAVLAKQGWKVVLNIRSDPERAAQQAEMARAAGLAYVYLPVPAYELETEHLAQIAAVIEQHRNGLVLQCRTASRVGLLWMLYRMEYQGWSAEAAQTELNQAGYEPDTMEGLVFCVEDYAERAGTISMS